MSGTGIRARWQHATATAMAVAWAGVAGAQVTQEATATVFSADVVIDDAIVDGRGTVVEARPQTRYRMTVRRVGDGLETELVHPPARLFERGPLMDPRGGYRYVSDQGFANPRIYDPSGALVRPADPAQVAGPAATTPRPVFTLADQDRQSRLDDLVRRFGATVGTVAGRDRYLSQEGDETIETLVEPSTVLPVEINVVRNGALAYRTGVAYARLPGGRWYVATTRSEQPAPGPAGQRFVSTSTYLNVVAPEVR
jgi:hypothetical protein